MVSKIGTKSGPRRPTGAVGVFSMVRRRIWRILPGPLRRVVDPSMVGFCMLSLFTYSVDLTLLYLMHQVGGWPYPLSVALGYIVAFALSFFLNRHLNFQSKGHVMAESRRYIVVAVINYLVFVVGLSTLLESRWHAPMIARIAAGLVEAVVMYSAMRWMVFKKRHRHPSRVV